MFGIQDLWLFIISGLILNILPGPDSLYIIGRSTSQGFRAGSMAAFGIGTGTLLHIMAAAFGLSAILSTSATAFSVVKIIGCLYLLYMGVSIILSKRKVGSIRIADTKYISMKKVFYQGFLTNVLNPKVALFFLAFVPQFISSESEHKALAFLLLGLVFNINGMIWCLFLAWSSSTISIKIKQNEIITMWLTRVMGGLFCYFGIRLALSDQS